MIMFNLLADAVQEDYRNCRLEGQSRSEAIDTLKQKYYDELNDDDESAIVMSGLVLALCKKKELTKEIAEEMLCYINKLAIPEAEAYLHKIKQLLSNPELYGKEASYRRRKSYDPLWNRGDLFAHTLMCPMSERLGIKGWKILLYKVSEFVDDSRHCRQIMLVSICPPEEEPSTSLELQKLGFVRMMRHDEKWDYLVQISLKNQKDLLSYELTKVANISEVAYPSDGTVEDPLVSMPLFGRLSKEDCYPHYESLICRLYRDHKCSST